MPTARHIQKTDEIFTCAIHIVHPLSANHGENKPSFYVHLSHQTCTDGNFVSFSPYISVNDVFFTGDYEWDRVVWTGCEPHFDPLPEVLFYQLAFWVSFHFVNFHGDYRVLINVSSSARDLKSDVPGTSHADEQDFSNKIKLEVVYLSTTLGNHRAIFRQIHIQTRSRFMVATMDLLTGLNGVKHKEKRGLSQLHFSLV